MTLLGRAFRPLLLAIAMFLPAGATAHAEKVSIIVPNALPDAAAVDRLDGGYTDFGTDVLHVSPHWFLMGKKDMRALGGTAAQITYLRNTPDATLRERVEKFARRKLPMPAALYDGWLLLDFEQPVHPRNFDKLSDAEIGGITAEWRRRIDVARAVFPRARVMLYGFPTMSHHRATKGIDTAWDGMVRAGRAGLFARVDAIAPVLYARHGPADRVYGRAEGLIAGTGIQLAKRLQTEVAPHLAIFPLLSLRVFNGNSDNHRERIETSYLQRTVSILRSEGITSYGIWSQDPDDLAFLAALRGMVWGY